MARAGAALVAEEASVLIVRKLLCHRGAPADDETAMDHDAEEGLSFETSKGVKVVTSFDDMGIRAELLKGVYAYGFEKPSAIQQRAILPITKGRDVIAQAQSGTGKTSMIALALCQMLDTRTNE